MPLHQELFIRSLHQLSVIQLCWGWRDVRARERVVEVWVFLVQSSAKPLGFDVMLYAVKKSTREH